MKLRQLADVVITSTRSPLSPKRVHDALKGSLCVSICVMFTGTVAAMGAGGGGGGGSGGSSGGTSGGAGSPAVESYLPRREIGGSAFKVYNEGVALMHAKNFVAAQIKFEQASEGEPRVIPFIDWVFGLRSTPKIAPRLVHQF